MKLISRIKSDPKGWAKKTFPIFQWLPSYRVQSVPYDLIAGLTVGLTVLPISLAYAQMAYLKPEYGLYSGFLGQFIYIFVGTSKDAIIGPSAISTMLLTQFNVLNPLADEGDNTYATLLAMTSGFILLLIGILKLGFIVNLFSIPVVCGFTSAAAFAISASQLKSLLGLDKGRYDSPGVFIKQIVNVFQRRNEINSYDTIFGLSSLAFLLFVEYSHVLISPKIAKMKLNSMILDILNMFVAARSVITFLVATSLSFYLHSNYEDVSGELTVVGYIKPGFVMPRPPSFQVVNGTEVIQSTYEVFHSLSVAIVLIPMMTIMETFAILKALGRKNGYRIDATHELIALGLGNFIQSFYYAIPITVATTKTVLNDQCKVKSSLSSLIGILIFLVSIGYLTPLFYYVPQSMLSAILIVAAHHLFDFKAALKIWREYRPDFFVFMATFLLCLLFDLAYGILIALMLNILTFIHPIIQSQLAITKEEHDLYGEKSTVVVVELSQGMKYPSVDKFIDKMAHILSMNYVHFVLDCRFVTGFDFTGMQAWHMLLKLAYSNHKQVIIINLSETVRTQLAEVGLEQFYHNSDIDEAIVDFNACNPTDGLRRFQRTISIVSAIIPHSVGDIKITVTPIDERELESANSMNNVGENRTSDAIISEEKLLLRLMESTAPNFHTNLPLTVGSSFSKTDNEGEEDSLLLDKLPVRKNLRKNSIISAISGQAIRDIEKIQLKRTNSTTD